MSKKKLWLIGCISLLLLVVGVSYAYWSLTFIQTNENIVMSDCFEIEFLEGDAIYLNKAYPMSDSDGLKTTPYTFSIQNTCNMKTAYQVNLEEIIISSKRLDSNYLKVSLNGQEGRFISSYERVEPTLENADISHKISTGVLKPSEKKSYDLRIWMDEETPAISEVMNASFESKITIQAIADDGIPEVSITAVDQLNEIVVDITTIQNERNEELKYYYQLNNENEIESEENNHTFSDLSDGKYLVKVRVETKSGTILEEKEMEVSIAYENVYVSNNGNNESGNGSIEKPFQTLQSAYNKVKSGGSILLLTDITANETTEMNIENKEVTIKSNGEEQFSIFRGDELKTSILNISNSNTVTTSNIVFDGRNVEANSSLLRSKDSILNLNEETIIQNGFHSGEYAFGGGVSFYSESGTEVLNIRGASIINNKVSSTLLSQGAGLRVDKGIVNIYSGIFSENAASSLGESQGGGIYVANVSLFLYDGTVSYNTSTDVAGGIFVCDSEMTFWNGSIISNTATLAGGGIVAWNYLTKDTIIYIKGGIIENNSASTDANIYSKFDGQIIDQRS